MFTVGAETSRSSDSRQRQVVDPALRRRAASSPSPRSSASRPRRCMRLLGRRDRPRRVGEAVDRRVVPSARDQRGERLHEVEGRAVEPRAVARSGRPCRAAAPLLAARDQLQLDDALGAEGDRDAAVGVLRRRDGMKTPTQLRERGLHLGPLHDLRGSAASRSPPRPRPRARGSPAASSPAPRIAWSAARNAACGPFWFTAPRPISTRPRPGLSTIAASQRRRRPLGRVDLLHVVHEVEADRPRRAGVEGGEDAGLAVGRRLARPTGSPPRGRGASSPRSPRRRRRSSRRSSAASPTAGGGRRPRRGAWRSRRRGPGTRPAEKAGRGRASAAADDAAAAPRNTRRECWAMGVA